MKHDTREGWLKAATKLMDKEFFEGRGYTLPEKLQVSCGFPFKSAKAIGQCWSPNATEDETIHVFVCPSLSDVYRVLGTLLHELIHAAVGLDQKHGGNFKKLVKEFGLAGKMTATYVEEGSELWTKLAAMRTSLGDYPHSAMKKRSTPKGPSAGGWIRMKSPRDDRYKVLVSPKMLEEFGPPMDPWGNEMEAV